MPIHILKFEVELKKLHDVFIDIIEETNFTVLDDKEIEDSLHILGVNTKRISQLSSTIFSWVGGYIEKNRIGIELNATKRGDIIEAKLKCTPYLPNFDMEIVAEGKDLITCENLSKYFIDELKARIK